MSQVPEGGSETPVTPKDAAGAAAPKAAPVDKKALRMAARAAAEARKPVPVDDIKAEFGDLPLINSSYKTDRVWTEIKELDASKDGQKVWIRARVHALRSKQFLILRRGLATIQVLLSTGSADLVKFVGKIPYESIIDVHGTVVTAKTPVESTSQKDVEVQVAQVFVISASAPLPFQMADANRFDPLDKGQNEGDEAEEAAEAKSAGAADGVIRVGQKKRLDNRFIDLRTFANHAVFRIQSKVGQFFRQYFIDRDFVELHSPKITPGVSEGGANVFRLDYFGQKCCLAQSPQVYKQMGVTADLFRVFEIGPVFRAEDSNTARHMCEFTGLDFEMEVREHYHEVLKTLSEVFVYIFDQINQHCQAELAAVNSQYPFTPLKYNKDVMVIPFTEARRMLLEAGENMGEFADPTTPQEKLLGRLMKEKYDIDLYIVDRYPAAVRPFYTMPCPDDPNYTNSYDVFLRGEEITSGAQRIHDPEMLAKGIEARGIPVSTLEGYINSFRFGATPHGGAGIGLERVVMLFLGLNNIRKSSLFPRVPNRVTP